MDKCPVGHSRRRIQLSSYEFFGKKVTNGDLLTRLKRKKKKKTKKIRTAKITSLTAKKSTEL